MKAMKRMYEVKVVLTILYGSETWLMNAVNISPIEIVENIRSPRFIDYME